jgi:hypothetical protein
MFSADSQTSELPDQAIDFTSDGFEVFHEGYPYYVDKIRLDFS